MKLRQMIVLAGFTLTTSVSHAAVNLINTESTVGGSQVNRDSSQSSFAPSGSNASSVSGSKSGVPAAHMGAPLPNVKGQGEAKATAYLPPASGTSPVRGQSTVNGSSVPTASAQKPITDEHPTKLKEVWTARQGETLRQSLGRWSKEAGFRLVWDTRINYSMVANVSFEGSYITSASKLIEAYEESASPLTVDFYPSQSLTLVKERTAE